jgi:hypothetical protein
VFFAFSASSVIQYTNNNDLGDLGVLVVQYRA